MTTFKKGELVVYPPHGMFTVAGEETRVIGNHTMTGLVLVKEGGNEKHVLSEAKQATLRRSVTEQEMTEALLLLESGKSELFDPPTTLRYKDRMPMLRELAAGGEILDVVRVLVELYYPSHPSVRRTNGVPTDEERFRTCLLDWVVDEGVVSGFFENHQNAREYIVYWLTGVPVPKPKEEEK